MNRIETMPFVLFGISNILQQILMETGALKAYSNLCLDTENGFLQIAEESISRQLTMNIAKLFDNASTCGKANCSIQQLRELCISYGDEFAKGNEDRTIIKIDEVVHLFEVIISKEVRNKKLAHFDLNELFAFKQVQIEFEDIQKLVNKLVIIIEELGERLSRTQITYLPIEEYSKFYKKELVKLQIQ